MQKGVVMGLSFVCAATFNWTLFITLMSYLLFFFIIIGAVLAGLKRGLVRSSIRLGTLIVFIIVAGLLTAPIAKALMGIDVSFLGVEYNGAVANNLSDVVKSLLFNINGVETAANASPALMQLIENIPYVVISLIVFAILTWIFRLIGFIVYYIIQRYALRSSRIEKQIKKQQKLEKKAKKRGEVVATQSQTVLKKPKRARLLGAVVGLVQGIVLAFVLFLPISSVCGIVGDLTTTSNEIVVSAEESTAKSENLNQKSGDLIRYYVGDDVLQYFDSYNNTFVAKFVAMGGLNNDVFDELTKISVENKDVKIRQEIFSITGTYDEMMDIFNFGKESDGWKDIDFDKINASVDKLLETNLMSSLVPELMPYALENYLYNSEMFKEIAGYEITQQELDVLMQYYSENGFISSLKSDLVEVFKIMKSVFSSGLFDEIYGKNLTGQMLKEYLTKDENSILNTVLDGIYSSKLVKVLGTTGLNFGMDKINTMLELEKPLKNFRGEVFKDEEKTGIRDVLLAILDCYDMLDKASSTDIKDMSLEQVNQVADLLTALQTNTFKTYDENGQLIARENTVVDTAEQDVVNGGPFSNVYIAVVDHFVKKYIENIDYEGANWHEVLRAVKAISMVDSTTKPELEDVMTVIGLDKELASSAKDIASSLKEISSGEELTNEKAADLLNNIATSADKISEEQFNNIVEKVGETLGDADLKNKVNYEKVVDEKNVASSLANLLTNKEGLTEENADEVLSTLATSEHILKQVAGAGIKVDSNVENLGNKIDALGANDKTKEELKTIFGINVG